MDVSGSRKRKEANKHHFSLLSRLFSPLPTKMQPSNTVGCAFFFFSQSSEKPQTACIARVRPLATTIWPLRGGTNEVFLPILARSPPQKITPRAKSEIGGSFLAAPWEWMPIQNSAARQKWLQSMETNSFLSSWQLFLFF